MNKQKAADMYDAKADLSAQYSTSERDGTLQVMFRDLERSYRGRADRLREAGKGGAR